MRRKKKTINRGISVLKRARNSPGVRAKTRMINRMEAKIKTLRRKKEALYKKALRRLKKKR
jgi:hypothetical protein